MVVVVLVVLTKLIVRREGICRTEHPLKNGTVFV